MRKTGSMFAVLAAAVASIGYAQPAAPGPLSVTIEGKTMSVKYAASAAKGRKIFGAVVPFKQVWRIGETGAATFHTDADLVFKGFMVPKGDYTLYVLPADAANWQLIVSKQTGGKPYDPKLDVGHAAMKVTAAPAPLETCRLAVVKTAAMAARIEVAWENVVAFAPFHLDREGSDSEW